jgi:hypothetical protein
MVLECRAGGQAQQHRQRRFQGVAEVAQGIARTLEAVFGVGQQMVDLRHQRLQFHRHLIVELRALALLQLGDLLARGFQRAQGARTVIRCSSRISNAASPSPGRPAHAPEALAHRGVVLGHADGDRLAQAAIVRAQHQQLLPFGSQLQVAVSPGWARRGSSWSHSERERQWLSAKSMRK